MLSRQLEYLVALAHERHFARAAERCAISQPALSLAVKQLEIELGIAIVQRGNRFGGFTPEGEIVLAWARRVLADEKALRQELRLCSGSLSGRLRIGAIPSAAAIASQVASAFVRAHPGIAVSDYEMTSADILRALASFELDAGITYVDNEPLERVRVFPVGCEEYVIVAPEHWPVAARAEVTWREASELPLCLLHRDMQNRRIVESIFESVGARPSARVETNSMMSKYCYLHTGDWASVMPKSFVAWLAPPAGSRIVPLVEPCVVKMIGLVIADRAPLPPMLAALWDHVRRDAPPTEKTSPVPS